MTLKEWIAEIRQKVSGLDYAADAYLNYANSVTGAEDTNVGDAMMRLAAGYGQGGGGVVILDFPAAASAPVEIATLTAAQLDKVNNGTFSASLTRLDPVVARCLVAAYCVGSIVGATRTDNAKWIMLNATGAVTATNSITSDITGCLYVSGSDLMCHADGYHRLIGRYALYID